MASQNIDIEAVMVFAEEAMGDAARLWTEADVDQKQKLQAVFFPDRLPFDGNSFRTARTQSPLHRRGCRRPGRVRERRLAYAAAEAESAKATHDMFESAFDVVGRAGARGVRVAQPFLSV